METPLVISFAPLQNSSDAVQKAAQRYDAALKNFPAGGFKANAATLTTLNERLYKSERLFLSEKGLPGRPWFKHQIYAPGAYTGYAVKTIPAVREAIEQYKWAEATEGVTTVGAILQKEATAVDEAAAQVEQLTSR